MSQSPAQSHGRVWLKSNCSIETWDGLFDAYDHSSRLSRLSYDAAGQWNDIIASFGLVRIQLLHVKLPGPIRYSISSARLEHHPMPAQAISCIMLVRLYKNCQKEMKNTRKQPKTRGKRHRFTAPIPMGYDVIDRHDP